VAECSTRRTTAAQTTEIPPKELIRLATKHGSFGIAYTYTEPLVWFEYLVAAGSLAHKKGLKNMLVTNGIINEQPMKELIPLIDAMNIDLKSMNPEFYRTYCHIDGLDAVLRTITMAAKSCHVEVTNLVIPGLNDSEEETRALVEFIANLSPAIPLHFSRYFPSHKMKIPSTPIETLERAAEIAREKLYYVSLGNVGLRSDSDTRCPECGNVLVRRTGYSGEIVGVSDGKCDRCGRPADFLWCD
jgi:pyruvate formate lyase activating enzyme